MSLKQLQLVTPAQAGAHATPPRSSLSVAWIPTFAGMTTWEGVAA
jgi:hypothetical protein